jgi:hypothetical protein
MTSYEMGDLQIVAGPIPRMRRNPAMYLGGLQTPKGEFLAARLVSDLVWLRALPAEVIEIDGWWVIRSSVDWLASGSPKACILGLSRWWGHIHNHRRPAR